MRDADIDSRWPHQVEIFVPWNGLRARLNEMLRWADAKGSDYKKRSAGRDHVRFCFGDPVTAAAFQAEFGGQLVEVQARVR